MRDMSHLKKVMVAVDKRRWTVSVGDDQNEDKGTQSGTRENTDRDSCYSCKN